MTIKVCHNKFQENKEKAEEIIKLILLLAWIPAIPIGIILIQQWNVIGITLLIGSLFSFIFCLEEGMISDGLHWINSKLKLFEWRNDC